jgi:hypothetical protein
MAVNKSVGDNAPEGAVKERSQVKSKMGDAEAWTKLDKSSGEFVAVPREEGLRA